MRLIMLLLFIHKIYATSADFNSESKYKYIDLLPDGEKKELFNRIARRISEQVQVKSKPQATSVEITDEQLNEYDGFIKKILEEESQNLRRNEDKNNKNSQNGEANKESNIEIIAEEGHVDLTLRQGLRKKRNDNDGEKLLDTTTQTYQTVIVKTVHDDKSAINFSDASENNTTMNSDEKPETDIQVRGMRHVPRRSNKLENKISESAVSDTTTVETKLTQVVPEIAETYKYEDIETSNEKSSIEETKPTSTYSNSIQHNQTNSESSTLVHPSEDNPLPKDDIIVKNIELNTSTQNIYTTTINITENQSKQDILRNLQLNIESEKEEVLPYVENSTTADINDSTTTASINSKDVEYTSSEIKANTASEGSQTTTDISITDSKFDNIVNVANTILQDTTGFPDITLLNVSKGDISVVVKQSLRNTGFDAEKKVSNGKNYVPNKELFIDVITDATSKSPLNNIETKTLRSKLESNNEGNLTNDVNKDTTENDVKIAKDIVKALRQGFDLDHEETKIPHSRVVYKVGNKHINQNKVNVYSVYEIAGDRQPLVPLNQNNDEQHYVPVYDYSPKNAYYNPYNRLGPNKEEDYGLRETPSILKLEDIGKDEDISALEENKPESANKENADGKYYFRSHNDPYNPNRIEGNPRIKVQDPDFSSNIAIDYYFGRLYPLEYHSWQNVDQPHAKRHGKQEYEEKLYDEVKRDKIRNGFEVPVATPHPTLYNDNILIGKPIANFRAKPKKTNTKDEEGKINTVEKIANIVEPGYILENFNKFKQIGIPIKRTQEDILIQACVEVMSDLVKRDDEAVQQYNWLETAVTIQSAMKKLKELAYSVQNSEELHPADIGILKYTVYLHKSAKKKINRELDLRASKQKKKYKSMLPRNKNKKQKSKHIVKTKGLIDRVWLYYRVKMPDDDEYTAEDFFEFLDDIQNCLHDLHDAIKHIAIITSYNTQNWYANLKELYLKDMSKKQILQVILHLSITRLLDIIEENSKHVLEDDIHNYIRNNRREFKNTRTEFIFVLKLMNAIKKIE